MALRLIGVSKRYGGQQVLSGVSLHVRPGDCYGFLGHNGAGKTTAMRIALGLVRPDAGRVLVEGFDAAAHPLEARARMGGLIEVPGFHPSLSGRRNLVLLARLQGLSRRESAAEADRVLDEVGLSHAAAKAAGAYSQGMRQRLGIAQALLARDGRPRIVLLDEPMNGLDPEGIEEIRRLLRRITREMGATVLLSSHQLHEIAGLCNRIGILRQGRLLLEDETAGLVGAGGARHVIRTGDDARAAAALAPLGVAASRIAAGAGAGEGGGIECDLGDRTPGDAVRALVAAGLDVHSIAPRETSLEEIYLRFTRSEGEVASAAPAEPGAQPAPPPERIAPAAPELRVARYDASRWLAGPAVPLALLAPAALGALSIVGDRAEAARRSADVAQGRVMTTTHVTAFTATAGGVSAGLPLLALVVAAVAALSIAGESGRGTLRNVLLRPVGRARAVLGKTAAALGAGAIGYAALVAASMAVAAAFFDFDDVVEILPGGKRYVFEGYAAKDLWPETLRCLVHQGPAVAAFAGIGVLLGALVRSGAAAVVAVFAVTVALIGTPVLFGDASGAALPTAYVPWPRLVVKAAPASRLLDVSTATSNAEPLHDAALWVPAAWLAAAVALSSVTMRRRAIP